jgi:hypothetical protein
MPEMTWRLAAAFCASAQGVAPSGTSPRATFGLWVVMTEGRPPWRPRARAGGQPGGGAFADEVAFELGQGGEDVEDELAAGGGGVDRFLEAAEPDAAVGQAGDGVDQVPQRAAEAVQFPDHEGVAGAQLVQELGEGGAVGCGRRWRSR